MGSLDTESDKPEFDDSGCVQDESIPMKGQSSITKQLLDLSDDVLLYILRHLSPRDLKALAFTCLRLCGLTLDHTLWQRVDARGQEAGPARMSWLLDHALSPATTELLITGFARQADGCLGIVNQKRKDAINEKLRKKQEQPQDIITADLRNNIITVTPSTAATVGFRVGIDNIGPNNEEENGNVAQENGNVAQENGNVAQENGNVAQENGVAQGNGAIPQENRNMVAITLRVGVTNSRPNNARNDDNEALVNDNQAQLNNIKLQRNINEVQINDNEDQINDNEDHINDNEAQINDNEAQINDTDNPESSNELNTNKQADNGNSSNMPDDDENVNNRESNNVHNDNGQMGNCEAGPSRGSGRNERPIVEEPGSPEHVRRRRVFNSWLERVSSTNHGHDPETAKNEQCPGPLFTFTSKMMKQLRVLCPNLTSLALDYCNINCQKTRLCHFPRTLKKLSLKGIKCYNLPVDKCFLFKIQDYMPVLEFLDVSECEWLEPASILGISKIPVLKHLVMRECCRLTEFVAYASLASRYGFKTLEIFDLRGSPLGDSEVSAISWIHSLRELYVSAARARAWPPEHTHYNDDHVPPHHELDAWEMDNEEPDLKFKPPTEAQNDGDSEDDHDEPMEQPTQDDLGHGMSESRYVIIRPRHGRAENREESRNTDSENGPEERRKNHKRRSGVLKFSRMFQLSSPEENQVESDDTERRHSRTNTQCDTNTKRKENGSGDAGDDQAGPSTKRRKDTPNPGSSKASEDTSTSSKQTKRNLDDSDTSDDDSDAPSKKRRHNNVNEGASTSKSASEDLDTTNESGTQTGRNPQGESNANRNADNEGYVHFRRNMGPEFVGARAPIDIEPLHKILYVNVSRRLHTVYRLSMPVCTVINSDDARSSDVLRHGRNISAIPPLFNTNAMHIDNASLVTDVAVRAFGESDTDNVNYIQIGPNGPSHYHRRPTRSNLRVLSITGFRNITDRSLTHLMTAAPHLRLLDLTRTSVTERKVENFRSCRPDCEVIHSQFTD